MTRTATLTLRTATRDDIGALDDLFRRSYTRLLAPDYPPSVLVTAIPAIGRAQPRLVESGLFYVVEAAGRMVAAGGWSLEAPGGRPDARGLGHVRHVATDPDHVRQGSGRRLMEHIARVAKGSGMLKLAAQSTRTAVPFYSAMGFAGRGEITVPLPGAIDFPAVYMERSL